jgi:hypothetical protein
MFSDDRDRAEASPSGSERRKARKQRVVGLTGWGAVAKLEVYLFPRDPRGVAIWQERCMGPWSSSLLR